VDERPETGDGRLRLEVRSTKLDIVVNFESWNKIVRYEPAFADREVP